MSDYSLFDDALKEFEIKNVEKTSKLNDKEDELHEHAEDKDDFCDHANISEDNGFISCSDCGIEMNKNIYQDKEWRYYGQSDNKRTSDPNRVHIRKMEERNIFKDVENMGFSDKIVYHANQIYLQVTDGQIFRGGSRKSLIFSCIFYSFKINKIPQTHEKLLATFEISRKSALKGLKYVNLKTPKDSKIHTTYITPINLVDEIMDKFSATPQQKAEVYELYGKIKNKSSTINRSRPQSISAGIVFAWICMKNLDISIKEFAGKTQLSELTILKIAREIAKILNVPIII
jgi:transcription initiation factor TFIIIB Brf1 subunit/transcription initiation factor TFIIB